MLKTKHEILNKDGVTVITFPELLGATACFTTRFGGVSKGRYSTLNMSFSNGDAKENVLENLKGYAKPLKLIIKI